ncbi:single-stranded DNA-binding protein [Clostridium ganghwense]|uniref:Single-stranded DNA-binding protein n=1 Tax=Clostridium ganghwense TaxID=312089 RepID=A0ABT4CRW3_9CLOT|nr:single-stranded DNA-binding protein [Clostridium ganghwense]MCY6370961.1 single-stranded DNA-binding protein [Clostridium ganghwense]
MNKVLFIGRLTKDIELKHIKENDKNVTNFTLAVDRPFLNEKGERVTDFIPVVAWERNAEKLAKHTKKGNLISVIGRLQMISYEGKDGVKRYISQVVAQEIQFLEWNKTKETAI